MSQSRSLRLGGLADLLEGADLEGMLCELAEHHLIALSLVDVEGQVLFHKGGALSPAVEESLSFEGQPLGRLIASGPSANSQLAKHIARLVTGWLRQTHARKLAAQMHLAVIEDARVNLAEMNARLGHALERLYEGDRLKSNFLATISHELRTPLTSVLGYAEILNEGMTGPLNADQRDCVRIILEKGAQLVQLISEVLDVSRMASGQTSLARQPVDLGAEIRDAVTSVIPMAQRKGVRLEASSFPTLPRVQGDRDKLRQVLAHVLDNAVKFTPEGGEVQILVDVAALDAYGGPQSVRLRVRDTGIGIPKDHHERIFEPFFQIDSSSTRLHGGAGVGLALVKNLVLAHGGRIWVESSLGQGSCFTLAFPAMEAGER